MTLSDEIQRLLPQAIEVIRFLMSHPEGATIEDIMEGTGFSERTSGKSIRRLVTRYFVEMPVTGVYRLTVKGRKAAEEVGDFSGDLSSADDESEEVEARAEPVRRASAPVERHQRRLTLFLPKELVIRSTTLVRAGFDLAAAGQPALQQPGRIILRLSVPGGDVVPVERPLEVTGSAPAGPAQFRITPHHEGSVHVKLEAFQLVTPHDLRPVGGMVFDMKVADFPTPRSAEFQTLGAIVHLVTRAEE